MSDYNYVRVVFPGDPLKRRYEYRDNRKQGDCLPLRVGDIVNVPVRKGKQYRNGVPNQNELAKVVSVSKRRTVWFRRIKSINFLAARPPLAGLWDRRFNCE